MSAKITVEASELWKYCKKNEKELESSMHEVASNDEFGIEIFVNVEKSFPVISVYADDSLVFEEEVISEDDCGDTASDIYSKYLSDSVVGILSGDDESETLFDEEDKISEREDELDMATYEFVSVVLEGYLDDPNTDLDEVCEDLKEHFLEYMARKHGLPVRRPMYLEDENGEDFFEEYPYECMEFEDKDNPIYRA